jgi:hypothetical protein
MARQRQWVLDPDAGGVKIPDRIKPEIKRRIERVAEKHFKGKYTRPDIRFRNQFCYIDAYREPQPLKNWPPEDWPETREQYLERLRNTPMHLCRLRHYSDRDGGWTFAFYKYSDEKYELCIFDNGSFYGTPEEAFLQSANVYLND